jgi:ElaB/YqjD/DUF883 family membrane-anchored ribosome-binding protein
MRASVSAAVVTAAFVLVAGSVSAQSLGEVAARTQKEKESKGKPAKVFTEADLRGRPSSQGSVSQPGAGNPGALPAAAASPAPGAAASPAPGAPGAPAAGATPPAGEKPKTPEEERAEQVAAWRERLTKAQEDVTRLTQEVNDLQTSLSDSSAAQYSPARAKAQSRLEAATSQLAAARANLENITEEGRRAGMR